LERKVYRVATGLLTGHCTFRLHLQITGLSNAGNVDRRKNFFYHLLCLQSAMAGHAMKIFGFVWLEPIDISRTSVETSSEI
jgi:hypothetical protein